MMETCSHVADGKAQLKIQEYMLIKDLELWNSSLPYRIDPIYYWEFSISNGGSYSTVDYPESSYICEFGEDKILCAIKLELLKLIGPGFS